MTKGDFPALRMVVENGRLVPATQFDQERVNSYRRGAIVLCKLNEEKDRVLVRKWFAIITLVVKQCQTPWKNKEDASEAIKLALGIVNLSKTVGGAFMQYPKSLTELDDPEMTEALEQMIELLSHMTGVDVETLKKEAADVGREIEHQDNNSAAADQSPSGQSPDSDETGPVSSQHDGGEVDSPSASPPSDPNIDDGLRAKLIAFTKATVGTLKDDALDGDAKRRVIEGSEIDWRDAIAKPNWPKMATVKLSAFAVIDGKRTVEQMVKYIAGELLECPVSEIGG